MKKREKPQKKYRALDFRLWDYCSAAVIYYAVGAIVFTVLFWAFFNVRDVCRALDVITTAAAYEAGNGILYQFKIMLISAACVASAFLALRALLLFYGVLLNVYRMKQTNEMLCNTGSSAGVDGPQGVGKTRMQIYTAIMLATFKLPDLLYKYYIDCPIRDQLKSANTLDYKRFCAREESIDFYFSQNADKIPLIYSNININYRGKTPFELRQKFFTMEERIYESNIKILSESDDVLPNTLSKERMRSENREYSAANRIDQYLGLDRQYTNGTLLSDTHENGSIYKSVRDCQQVVYHLIRSNYIYTPRILTRLYEKQKNKILESEEKTTLKQRKRVKMLEKFIKQIGFTRIYYVKQDGGEGILLKDKDLKFMTIPNQVPYSYDDRDMQKGYEVKPIPKKPEKEKK